MGDPLVSISIPTYNRPKELKKALDSAINQSYKNLEIVISDNHSEDPEVEKLCREYVQKDNRIIYFRQEKNLGIGGNGQFLINVLKGEYCMVLCDDDWLSLNYIEEGVKTYLEYPDTSIVYGQTLMYNEEGEVIEDTCFHDLNQEDFVERADEFFENANRCRLSTGMFKTQQYQCLQDLTKDRLGEDYIFMAKMLFFGKMKILPQICYHKLLNGYTKDWESLVSAYSRYNLTPENIDETLTKILMDSILYDDFYLQRLERNRALDLALRLYDKFLERKRVPQNNVIAKKDLLKFIYIKPFALLSRDFKIIIADKKRINA